MWVYQSGMSTALPPKHCFKALAVDAGVFYTVGAALYADALRLGQAVGDDKRKEAGEV